ncbi:Uncharacterised protein [Mycobacteroides abscessus subsp. abscessus]|nr:Uncharacterised protein [Mycobacteroides abscessus subsp. abscessus]
MGTSTQAAASAARAIGTGSRKVQRQPMPVISPPKSRPEE